MSNDEQAKKITSQLAALLRAGSENVSEEDALFADAVPSEDFLNAHLPSDGPGLEEASKLADALDSAVAANNMAVVKQVAGLAMSLIPGLKGISGLV